MWLDAWKHLPDFGSAVLTGRDEEGGYPYSTRCRPVLDGPTGTLRIELHPGAPIRPGPAGLLCHRHDENLGDLRSFLVRGTLDREGGGWTFHPDRFVRGAGTGGALGSLRFFFSSRRNARRYLRRRGLPRPRVPWNDIDAARERAAGER